MATLVNTRRVIRQISRWEGAARRGARDAFRGEFDAILERAKYYAPIETGELRASGKVVGPVTRGDSFSIRIEFDAPHAVFVHERLDLQHAPPTQAKFLERARNERIRGMEGRVAIAARRAARGIR